MDEHLLFSDDEGPNNGGHHLQLTINDHYAKAFEYRKEREELERLKAKYGSDYDPDSGLSSSSSTDSESAESEDEDGEELTPIVDVAILRTLARIKEKDPDIYDSSKNIFGEEQGKIASKSLSTKGLSKSRDKSKPVTIRQAALDSMLHGSRSPSPEDDGPLPPTYVEEQEKLREATIAAFHDALPEGEGDDFLVARGKTKDELEMEEEEYRAFLEREVGDLNKLVTIDEDSELHRVGFDVGQESEVAEKADKKAKKEKKKKKKDGSESGGVKQKKPQAEKDHEFLMNYILNRGWIDRSERHVPTYEEITSTKRKTKVETAKMDGTSTNGLENPEEGEEDTGLLSDSSFDSLASHFEASYNHRFEEPGAATIPSFPRNIQSTVRRQDTTRKEARERRKARKEEELAKKKEDVKRLKALKLREVRRKLEIIGRQVGLKGKGKGKKGFSEDEDDDGFVDEALRELDLEGDWNPEKHDQQMAGLFDRDADAFEDDGAGSRDEDGLVFDSDGKPVWGDDIDIDDIIMPGDDDDNNPAEAGPSRKEEKKKKKKKKKKKDEGNDDNAVDVDAMDADVEPVLQDDEEWDGTEEMRKRVLKKYMDHLDGLDFNDMVADLPTRFKYVPVQSTDYSLTPAEVLIATDKELNEYMSVKKYAPYRLAKADKYRFGTAQQEKLRDLKSKVAGRAGGFGFDRSGHAERDLQPKKRKGKKERMRLKSDLHAGAEDVETDDDLSGSKKRKRDGDDKFVMDGTKGSGVIIADNQERSVPMKKRKRQA